MLKILFLIENVPFSLDSRVRRQTDILKKAGAKIIVICPSGNKEPFHSIVDDIHVYRYKKPNIGKGFASHILEYITSLIAQTIITFYIFFKHGFDVIHVANPPDILWLVALPYKLFGKKFIYDQHDLVPELYQVRYRDKYNFLTSVVNFMEKMSYKLSDHVVSTNDTFRQFAINRGGVHEDRVTVVRNGPWLSKDFKNINPDQKIRAMKDVVIGYLGIMNPQDHLDNFIKMANAIYNEHNIKNVAFVMIGSGDSFIELKKLRDDYGLTDVIKMTGSIPWNEVISILSATDICIQPDPPTAFNKHLTMNKLMEYMALGKAIVAYDMPETRISGGDTIRYVSGESNEALVMAVLDLINDSNERNRLGINAKERIVTTLAWEHQAQNLLDVYQSLFPNKLNISTTVDDRHGERNESG